MAVGPLAGLGPTRCSLSCSLAGHTSGVLSATFTRNGRFVLTTSQDKSLRLWNPHNGTHVKTYSGEHQQEVNDAVITNDNAKFFSCGSDKQVFQWDVTTAQVIRKFPGHDRKVNALAFGGPSQDVVLSASHDRSVRLWDLRARSRMPIQTLDDATDSVLCVVTAGDVIITGSTDGGLRQYDVRMGQLVVDHLLKPIGSICLSNGNECALVSTLDDTIRLIDRETGNELAIYKGHANQRFKVQSAFAPSGSCVVSGSEDKRVCMWELVDGKLLCELSEHAAPVLCTCFFEDTLVTAAADGGIMVWKTAFPSGPSVPSASFRSGGGLPVSFGKQQGRQVPVASARQSSYGQALAPSSPELAENREVEGDPDVARGSKRGDRGKKRRRK
mmetsp:Transcript_49/g.169  ORF Transcript_49/g.169 Transcript_49/m.169 type:complete len:386 (+) Transcript_49:34-1191(+)